MLNIIGIMSGNPWIMAASFLSYTSLATADMSGRTWQNISRGLGYAGQAVGAGYLAWNVGVGVANWIYEPNARVILPGGGTGTAQDIDRYGEIFVPGINTTEEASINIATKKDIPVFYNPSHGSIADVTESFLEKITFTGSVDRQFASVLNQTTNPINIIAHSQGTIITSNALVQLGFTGQKLAEGSKVAYMAAAISQPRAIISAFMGRAAASYTTNLFDPISVTGPNVNPVKFFGGMAGGATQGAKYHALLEYGIQS